MNKWNVIALFSLSLAANPTTAQPRVGYVDLTTILSLHPDRVAVDTLVDSYRIDTLGKQFDSLINAYHKIDSLIWYNQNEFLSRTKRERYPRESTELREKIQNWYAYATAATDQKRRELLAPVLQQIREAVASVAAKQGYTHVFRRANVIVAPETNDLTAAVLTELGLPPQDEEDVPAF